jgi:two-component system, OmpR family, phosphate regulon response regulator PhoB
MQKSACRVLIVDDERDVREGLAELLTGAGFDVSSVRTAAEAWQRLQQPVLPNVIVLDLVLPDVDGWDFNSRLKRDPRLAAIPIVAISGAGKLVDAARSLRKPVDPEELIGILAHLC